VGKKEKREGGGGARGSRLGGREKVGERWVVVRAAAGILFIFV
jgi:hypothetical protein